MRALDMRTLKNLAVAVLAATLAPLAAFGQSDPCFADWATAGAVVKAQGLVTVDELTKQAPAKLGGEVVRSTLCESKGSYRYKLVIRDPAGHVKTVTVDARMPFDR
jgi:uncharacterized membrane protein YkoI